MASLSASSSSIDPVPDGPDAFDEGFDHLTIFEIERRGSSQPHAFRGSGRDDIARLEGQALAERMDDRVDRENHVPGIRVLPHLAVHAKGQLLALRIAELVRRDHPWAHRA